MNDSQIIIGVDEAGRGPLFGPVYTGAVILPAMDSEFDRTQLKDSKKFTSKKKLQKVFENIINEPNCIYSVNSADHEEIDALNILQATQKSMHRSVTGVIQKYIDSCKSENCEICFDNILICVDGNYFHTFKYFYQDTLHIINHKCMVKGDALCKEISAASILAKYSRDEFIEKFVQENPTYDERYNLLKNKGYGTKQHIEGIKTYGYTPYHRKTFKLKNM